MNRLDLYSPVHKGVRAALVQTASLTGRTDFADPEEAATAAEAARRLVHLLEEHAANEDRELMPILARVAPEVHADLQAEHARTDGLAREIVAFADRLASAPVAERASIGRRIHDALWRLAAEHLRHMDREETQASRALWAHLSDEELEAIHQRIVAAIPPAELAEFCGLLIPAMSLPERAAMLAPLAQRLPPPAFEALIAPARRAMGDAWGKTAAAIGL